MISQRTACITGVILSLWVAASCRDAPTEPASNAGVVPLAANVSGDSAGEFPPQPRILNPYTQIDYVEQGGQHLVELRVGMEYLGNKASMTTEYSVVGDGISQRDRIYNEQDAFYALSWNVWKRFDQVYYVQIARSCGLEMNAATQHQAWWLLYLRVMPDWRSIKATAGSRATPMSLPPCEEAEPEPVEGETERINSTTSSGGGGDGSSGSITITTCWYWATIENGVVVSIELDYCTVYTISLGPMEM